MITNDSGLTLNKRLLPHNASAILDEGYLVQWADIDPATGNPRKPSWVSKKDCSDEFVERWSRDSKTRSTASGGHGSTSNRTFEIAAVGQFVKEEFKEMNLSRYARTGTGFPSHSSEANYSEVRRGSDSADLEGRQYNPRERLPGKSRRHFQKARRDRRSDSGPYQPKLHDKRHGGREPDPTQTQRDSPTEDLDTEFELTTKWLIPNPALSASAILGLEFELKGTIPRSNSESGWYNGDLEGVQGVILSVMNVRDDDYYSTAQVKFLDDSFPPELGGKPPGIDTNIAYAVPVKFLVPVQPAEAGEDVVILWGKHRGVVAKLREEDRDGWLVSDDNLDHFVVGTEKLAKWMKVDRDGNRI